MELGQLLQLIRQDLDDEAGPYLFETDRLVQALNEAMREVAVRSRLLVESLNPAVCQITLEAGRATYDLHKSVIFVRRAALAARPHEALTRTTFTVLDRFCSDWRTRPGDPEYLLQNLQGNGKSITLSPVPTKVDTLQLTVVRKPLDVELFEVGDNTAEPPFDDIHHENLKHWVCYRMLAGRDVEQGSAGDAATHLSLFEAAFGPRPDAAQIQQLAIDPITSSSAVWF